MEKEKPTGTFRCDGCGRVWDGSQLLRMASLPKPYTPMNFTWRCGFLFCEDNKSITKISDESMPEEERKKINDKISSEAKPIGYIEIQRGQ